MASLYEQLEDAIRAYVAEGRGELEVVTDWTLAAAVSKVEDPMATSYVYSRSRSSAHALVGLAQMNVEQLRRDSAD